MTGKGRLQKIEALSGPKAVEAGVAGSVILVWTR